MTQLESFQSEPVVLHDVVLFQDGGESVLFSGDLEACEDWLALNGDRFLDGYFEIRPGSV